MMSEFNEGIRAARRAAYTVHVRLSDERDRAREGTVERVVAQAKLVGNSESMVAISALLPQEENNASGATS